MTTIETFDVISQQLNIYIGIILFILGIYGNLWNILVFRHRFFRSNSCCIYMSAISIASLIELVFGLLPRIITKGFHHDWILTNIVWCKLRTYITQCTSLTVLSCFVWTAIDRFFSSCRQIKWRYLNSVYLAKQICSLTFIFWMIFTLPTNIFIEPNLVRHACLSSSLIWTTILIYFINLLCYGIFPWFFMSLFVFLTLKNLRQRINPLSPIILTRTARLDHQLTSMLLVQIILVLISSIPQCIQTIYDRITDSIEKTDYRQAQEYLFLQIVRLIFYINYISIFYVNYFSSSIFRRLSKRAFKHLCKKKQEKSRNTVIIKHQQSRKSNTKTITPKPYIIYRT